VICAWCRAELAAAVCRAYNRWLADYCKPYPDRLFGVAMLPMFLQR
jgi:predicted TIM-barrel fold metal-dependent hydrolase